MREPFLLELKDGTLKQRNPFTGTEVWTIPGRAHRPLGIQGQVPQTLDPHNHGYECAFCERRYLDTPPEKSRLVSGPDNTFRQIDGISAEELNQTVAEFRRIPNLFEILSLDYWRANYDYQLPAQVRRRQQAYLATSAGKAHIANLVVAKRRSADADLTATGVLRAIGTYDDALAQASDGFFGGGHDVIVARRHFVDGARQDTQLASSGTLTPAEHEAFLAYTAHSAQDLLELNPYARYVVVFQNWLRPAGASFDHLHKQIVAIDEHGERQADAIRRVRENPNVFNDNAVNYAMQHNLLLAENDHAIAFAGFGHRFPTIEVFSKSAACEPWAHEPAEMRAVSDLLHAMHRATGTNVATNEEWHYRPADGDLPTPWRIMLKWRLSTLAGFEGATKIYLNTISPRSIRDRVLPDLRRLRAEGVIADMRIGEECSTRPNPLKYPEGGRA